MKRFDRLAWMMVVLALIILLVTTQNSKGAVENQLEKRQNEAIEKLIQTASKTDGNYSSISLKNWQKEIGLTFLSNEDLVRKILDAFEKENAKLNILDYHITYTNKAGGGIEYDFIIIHHEPKPEKYYRLVTRPAKD